MRNPLPIGQKLLIGKCSYIIDKILGTGSSCIAYEARKIADGAEIRCRIKECYPYDAQVQRKGLYLIWNSDEERKFYMERFKKGASILNELHNRELTGNNTTTAEYAEANNTSYSVMEINYGALYDLDKKTDLKSIIDAIKVLAKVISNLHEEGYLHLDIKPENFLVSYNPSPYIWLFDTDTVVPFKEIEEGTFGSLMCSKAWAAPELIQGQIKKIGPWTDIFSIGSVLFYKIMGRRPSVDDIGLFSTIQLPPALVQKENPQIIRLLKTILKKSVTAGINSRYKSAEDMYADLEAVSVLLHNGKPYLLSNFREPISYFTGREKEILLLSSSLIHDENHYMFIQGEGGIGKSELSKRYGYIKNDRYDTVIFLRYQSSIHDCLLDIPIGNFEGTDEEKIKTVEQLLSSEVLLIIDNFDVPVDQEDELTHLLQTEADIIITTRTDFSSVISENHIYRLGVLENEILEKLFEHFANIKINTDEDHRIFNQICDQVAGHTYAIELIARNTAYRGINLKATYQQLKNGIMDYCENEKIITVKDDVILRKSIPDIMKILFRLSDLSAKQKQVLRNMVLLGFMVITKDIYQKTLQPTAKEFAAVNELIEIGLIRCDSEKNDDELHLHPLIIETVRAELKPRLRNCKSVYLFIQHETHYFYWIGEDGIQGSIYSNEDIALKYEYLKRITFFMRFFSSIDISEDKAIELYLDFIKAIGIGNGNGKDDGKWLQDVPIANDDLKTDYNKISDMLRKKRKKTRKLFYTQLAILYAWLKTTRYNYLVDIELREKEREIKIKVAFEDCLRTGNYLTESGEMQEASYLIIEAFANTAIERWGDRIPTEIVEWCNDYLDAHYNQHLMDLYVSPYIRNRNSLIGKKYNKTNDAINPAEYTNTKIEKKEKTLNDEYFNRLNSEKDKTEEILNEIINDSRLSKYEKVEILDDFMFSNEYSMRFCINPKSFIKAFRNYDHTEHIRWMNICIRFLKENYCSYDEIDNYAGYYEFTTIEDIFISYQQDMLIIAGLKKNKKMANMIASQYLKRFEEKYIQFRNDYRCTIQEYPFESMGSDLFIQTLYLSKYFETVTVTVWYCIKLLEIQRRIPEAFPEDIQIQIDRKLIDDFYDVIAQIDAALECEKRDPGVMSGKDAHKLTEYRDYLSARIDHIVDGGYRIKDDQLQ